MFVKLGRKESQILWKCIWSCILPKCLCQFARIFSTKSNLIHGHARTYECQNAECDIAGTHTRLYARLDTGRRVRTSPHTKFRLGPRFVCTCPLNGFFSQAATSALLNRCKRSHSGNNESCLAETAQQTSTVREKEGAIATVLRDLIHTLSRGLKDFTAEDGNLRYSSRQDRKRSHQYSALRQMIMKAAQGIQNYDREGRPPEWRSREASRRDSRASRSRNMQSDLASFVPRTQTDTLQVCRHLNSSCRSVFGLLQMH